MAMFVDHQAMLNAVSEIDSSSKSFATKAKNFIATLTNTLSTFSGETKDILVNTKIGTSGSEVEGTLAYFLEKQCPDLVAGLGSLLEGNRSTIDDSDRQLAEAISGNGGK